MSYKYQPRWYRVDGVDNPAIGLFLFAHNYEEVKSMLASGQGRLWNELSEQEQREYHTKRLKVGAIKNTYNTFK